MQRSQRLCEKNDKYYARNAKAVKLLRNEYMQKINAEQGSGPASFQADVSISMTEAQNMLDGLADNEPIDWLLGRALRGVAVCISRGTSASVTRGRDSCAMVICPPGWRLDRIPCGAQNSPFGASGWREASPI
jgi:hypothetical protein